MYILASYFRKISYEKTYLNVKVLWHLHGKHYLVRYNVKDSHTKTLGFNSVVLKANLSWIVDQNVRLDVMISGFGKISG